MDVPYLLQIFIFSQDMYTIPVRRTYKHAEKCVVKWTTNRGEAISHQGQSQGGEVREWHQRYGYRLGQFHKLVVLDCD